MAMAVQSNTSGHKDETKKHHKDKATKQQKDTRNGRTDRLIHPNDTTNEEEELKNLQTGQ